MVNNMIKRRYFVSAEFLDNKFNSKFHNSIFWTRSWFPCIGLQDVLKEVMKQTGQMDKSKIKILSFNRI